MVFCILWNKPGRQWTKLALPNQFLSQFQAHPNQWARQSRWCFHKLRMDCHRNNSKEADILFYKIKLNLKFTWPTRLMPYFQKLFVFRRPGIEPAPFTRNVLMFLVKYLNDKMVIIMVFTLQYENLLHIYQNSSLGLKYMGSSSLQGWWHCVCSIWFLSHAHSGKKLSLIWCSKDVHLHWKE